MYIFLSNNHCMTLLNYLKDFTIFPMSTIILIDLKTQHCNVIYILYRTVFKKFKEKNGNYQYYQF